MKTFIGADHAGFKLKEKLKPYLTKLKYQVIDFGNKKYQENDDYPIYGIRAALAEDTRDAYLARRDDNCNIICLQGRYTNLDKAKIIVKMFLETKFKALKRYKRRINEIKKLEK